MKKTIFIDTEIDVKSKKIVDIGAITTNGVQFHSTSITNFFDLIPKTTIYFGLKTILFDLKSCKSAIYSTSKS